MEKLSKSTIIFVLYIIDWLLQELDKSNAFIIIFGYNIIFKKKNQNMCIGFNVILFNFSKFSNLKIWICLIFSPKSSIKRYAIIIIASM